MKKMPTLYVREFAARGEIRRTLNRVTDGCEWVKFGEGVATEKVDGSCCAILDGKFYKRYDANVRKGRAIPKGAIPCQDEPDPVTGHWPCWVAVDSTNPADRWYWNAYINSPWIRGDGTYEAVGLHFQSNPYGLDDDFLEKHGRIRIPDEALCDPDNLGIRSYDAIKEYLRTHEIEGIVFHRGNGEMCKIKRTDFGFIWPVKKGADE